MRDSKGWSRLGRSYSTVVLYTVWLGFCSAVDRSRLDTCIRRAKKPDNSVSDMSIAANAKEILVRAIEYLLSLPGHSKHSLKALRNQEPLEF